MLEVTTVPRIHPQVAARILDGRAIIVLADVGEVLVLNPSGARLWQQIDGRRVVGDLAAALATAYQIDAATARQDAQLFVQTLIDAGAVETQVTPPT